MKRLVSFFALLVGLTSVAKSQEFRGGETTWDCLETGTDAGKYQFSLVLFYDCSGGTAFQPTQLVSIENSTLPGITLNLLSNVDLTVPCYDPAATVSCTKSSLRLFPG